MRMIKTPIDFKEEDLAGRISRFKDVVIESRIKDLDNSDSLFVRVYFGDTRYTEPVQTNRLITDFIIEIRDGVSDETIILAMITAVLYKNEIINESKDLWILVDKCCTLLSDGINAMGLNDMNGNILVMPRFLYSPDEFKGFVYHC